MTSAPVKHTNGFLTQYTCPCGATVVFTAMGAGLGWNYRCDKNHKWLLRDGKWERK